MNDARYEELLGRVLDDELTEPEAAELAEGVGRNQHRARDLRQHLALWELYAQHVAVERGVDAFVASCETRLRAEADSEVFAERVETELLERSQAGTVLPVREPLRSRLRSHAGKWFERWRLGFALAGVIAVLMAGFFLWQPIEGQPVLVAHSPGSILVERAGAAVPISEPFKLRPFDVLTVTGTNPVAITYGRENTHLELHPGARLKLLAWESGKRFQLERGKVEASVARQRWRRPMSVSTPVAEARVLGTKFTLAATVKATRLDVADGKVRLIRTSDGQAVDVAKDHYAVAGTNAALNALPKPGSILREYWTNLPTRAVNDLLDHPDYPNRPSGHDWVELLEVPIRGATNYGCRLVGYLHPPVTGDYIFWIAASPEAAFNMSQDENPANAVRVFGTHFDFGPGLESKPREWERMAAASRTKSQPIRLVAGRRYFVEAIHKADLRGGHLAIAWTPPGGQREVITREYLSPLKPKPKVAKR